MVPLDNIICTIKECTTIPLHIELLWWESWEAGPNLKRSKLLVQGTADHERDCYQYMYIFDNPNSVLLDAEYDTFFKMEWTKSLSMKQLYTRLVPKVLRFLVTSAVHSSPLTGHISLDKKCCKVDIFFWWPGMASKIRWWVIACTHMRQSNSKKTA